MRRLTTHLNKRFLRLLPAVLIITLILSIIGPNAASADPGWYNSSWLYRKKITIYAANVSATLTNFPVLVSLASDTDLAADALDNGNDILFTAADEVTKLSHEIERFDGTTGNLTAWVKIPTLSSVTDTDIYMYYGNAGAANQQDATGVWDSNYNMVQHMEETSGGPNAITDSTSNGYNGTDNNSPTFGAAGKINGALSFDGTNDYIGFSTGGNITRPLTIEVWIKPNVVPVGNSSKPIVFRDDGARMNYSLSIASGTYVGSTGVKPLFWREDVVDTDNKTYGTTEISAGNWYHIVVVDAGSQGVSGNFSIYVNGGAPEGVLSCNLTAYDGPTHKLTIADTNGERIGGGAYFNGMIDEVRISNSARSAAWITTSYKNQINPSGFITLGAEQYIYSIPTVTTGTGVSLLFQQSALLHGKLTSDGGEACQFSIEWGTAPGVYTSNTSWTSSYTTNQTYSYNTLNSGNLTPGQIYYYRAKAKNSAGIGYSAELEFLTPPYGTTDLNAVAANSSQINLTWTKGIGANRTMIRRKAGDLPSSYTDGYEVYFGTGTSANDTGLSEGITYYYKTWSEVSAGSSQQWWGGDWASTATNPIVLPTLTVNDAYNVDETSASFNGTLTSDGGMDCFIGFVWGTTSGVYTNNQTDILGPHQTGYTSLVGVGGLAKGQKYYYRVWAQNNAGIGYSAEMEFLTKPDGPVILTATANSSSRIDLTWTMGEGAGRTMIRRSTGAYPASYTDGAQVYFDTGISYSDTGLSGNVTYYYRGWSEKTGSQQFSNTFVSASATTFAAPLIPGVIGGKVFTVNKAAILVPWILLGIVSILILIRIVFYVRKKLKSRPPPEKTSQF